MKRCFFRAGNPHKIAVFVAKRRNDINVIIIYLYMKISHFKDLYKTY